MGSFTAAVPVVLAVLLLAPPTCLGQSFCDPDDGYQPGGENIPMIPEQFLMHVEANIINQNRTVWVEEYFDGVTNKAKLVTIINNTREQVILDFANNEIFTFPNVRAGMDCTVETLTSSLTGMAFGVTAANGSIRIPSASSFVTFINASTPVKYIGPEVVRGVPSVRWQACLGSGSILADYYFSAVNWNFQTLIGPENFDDLLTKIEIQGESVRGGNYSHVYSIVGFQYGPDSVPESEFVVPTGLTCTGRKPGLPLPTVPDFFSTYIQFSSDNRTTVSTIREYYDITHNLFRLDAYYDGGNGGEAGPYSIVHDFDTQLQYVINRHTSNCTVTTLDQGFLGDITIDEEDGSPRLRPPSQAIFLGGLNYTYEGVSIIRGIEVDSWIATSEFYVASRFTNVTNGVYEVFFTRPGYVVNTDRSPGEAMVPWRVLVSGTFISNFSGNITVTDSTFELDFFDFSANEPPYDSFDVSMCAGVGESHLVLFAFETTVVGIDFGTFRTNLRNSVVQATNLKPLQVSNIQIVSFNSTHIFVAFHIIDISDLATISDTDVVVTADEALNMLQVGDGNPLPFQVKVSETVTVNPTFISTNNTTCPTMAPCKCNDDNITNRLNLTDGIVAGIAIGLFFAGVLSTFLFILFCYCCLKCFRTGSFNVSTNVKYNKHDDEVET